jgi:hypothetical protein
MNAALVLAAVISLSAFDYRPEGGEGLFPYESAAASNEPMVNIANPSSLPFQNGFFLSTHAENPYGLRGLGACGTTAGYASGGTGVSASWSRFGMKEYCEDRAFLSVGRQCGIFSLGVRGHVDRVSIEMSGLRAAETAADADCAVRVDPLPFLSLGCVQQNAGSVFIRSWRDLLYPETDLGVSVSPARGIDLSWNYNRTFYGGVNTVSCSVNLFPSFRIGAGYSKETERYAVMSVLLLGGVRISYSFSYHPSLGVTHGAGVSWSPSSTEFTPVDSSSMSYPASGYENAVTVDITGCSADELAGVSGIPDEMAERIVRYRELFGRVSEKTLSEMGLSPSERNAVMAHAEGIISEKQERDETRAKKEREWQAKRSAPKEKAKDLFLRLVDAGVAPPKALKAAQIAKRKTGADFTKEISLSTEFSAEEKKRIESVCSGQ